MPLHLLEELDNNTVVNVIATVVSIETLRSKQPIKKETAKTKLYWSVKLLGDPDKEQQVLCLCPLKKLGQGEPMTKFCAGNVLLITTGQVFANGISAFEATRVYVAKNKQQVSFT